MLPITDALARIRSRLRPLPSERVFLADSLGRFLARGVDARSELPARDESAMDGFAVHAIDVTSARPEAPIRLRRAGESRAGGPLPRALDRGDAVRVFTGAAMPEGADAVLIQEDVSWDDGAVTVSSPVAAGRHVRRRGEILRAGTTVLGPGAKIGPGEVGVLASQSCAVVEVHRRPTVAILSTGDELADLGRARDGELVDSNAYMLAAAVRAAGGVPTLCPRGADDAEELRARIEEALASNDGLVTTGGVSVGDYDLVGAALDAAGVDPVFARVAIKPGKPVRFGMRGQRAVFGLPGNPVSAFVTFELFVRPLLRAWLGDPRPYRRTVSAILGDPQRCPDSRTELRRVRFLDGTVVDNGPQGSAALTSTVDPHGLLVLPEGGGELPAGSRRRVIDLRDSVGSSEPPTLFESP